MTLRARVEVGIGRSLAFCVHPVAAWRVLSPPRRALIAGAYFAAGYLAILAALFSL